MTNIAYSLADIHLPENKILTHFLKQVSFTASVIVMMLAAVVLLGWVANISFLKTMFIGATSISPVVTITCILAATSFLIEEKISLFLRSDKISKHIRMYYYVLASFFAATVLIVGILYGADFLQTGNMLLSNTLFTDAGSTQASFGVGLNFLLLGIMLLLPRTKAAHRFHAVHILVFIGLILTSTTILNTTYHLILSILASHTVYLPLNIAILFFLLYTAASFRWPARGFIGLFTTDAVGNIFSLKLLVGTVALIPFLGFVSLLGMQMKLYGFYEAIVVFAVLLMMLVTIVAWFNNKLLYKFELENYLMKEELRVHNIDLTLHSEDLAGKMTKLQQANEDYSGKLNSQETYKNLVENLS